MEEWKECRLGDVLNFRRGYDLPKDKMANGKVPVAGSNGIIGWHDVSTDISPLITIGRSGSVGHPNIYDKAWAHNTTLYIDDFKGNDPKFLYYLLFSLPLAESQAGSAVPTLNRNHIHPLPIVFPNSLSEQKKIAGILSALDEKIETNRKINARLEELAQAIFKSWFIDFTPFGGQMPEDWEYKFVSDFPHEIETGRRPKGGVSGFTDGIPSIGAESIKGIGYYDYSKTKYIPIEYAETLKTGRIQDFDLLIYKDGGKPGYFIPNFSMMGLGFPFKKMFLNEHVFRLNFGLPELNIFTYFFFKTDKVMSYLNSVGGKAAIPGINQKNVEDIVVIDLNLPQIKKFGEIVFPIFKQILENCKENARLSELRNTLLPKLMCGEIKV